MSSYSAIRAEVGRRRGRCCRLPHLLRAPGVGDNALTGLLNIQTHLEPTSEPTSAPPTSQAPAALLLAESKPQTLKAWEELKLRIPFTTENS